MSELFLGKFRTKSMRLKGHDYSNSGIYCVTILTNAAISFFGKINESKMHLSPAGKIISENWQRLPERFASVSLDEYVIMPDHFHGILIIYHPRKDAIYRVSSPKNNTDVQFSSPMSNMEDQSSSQKVEHIESQKSKGGITKNHNPMISQNSLSYYIRWFKGKSTYQIRSAFPNLKFSWHPGYYDTIIRDKKALCAARKYIKNNPITWEKRHMSF
jgi:REP element-mobilizing transposase RayT